MFFKHPKTLPKLNITVNGNLIDQVSEFNFLGITIDENITWNPHIRNTSIKIARVIGILRKLKRIFPRHILRLIYNSTFVIWFEPMGIQTKTHNCAPEKKL